MKILISPQQFKESLTGSEIADSMEKGILRVWPNSTIKKIPVADGGDGTLETLVSNSNGEIKSTVADNSNFEKIKTEWGALGDKKTAVIEVARVIGLSKISSNKRNVMKASSYGLGSVFKEALDQGYRNFIVPVGGSATNDGGAGLLQALGVSLKNKAGKEIAYGGHELRNLEKIDVSGLDERMLDSNIMVPCDVSNPLCGPRGASAIYGPQKGATFEQIQILDQALLKFSEIIKRDLGKDNNKPPMDGNIDFINHATRMYEDLEIGHITFKPRTGDAYIFPARLFHTVYPFLEGDENCRRLSISWNAITR